MTFVVLGLLVSLLVFLFLFLTYLLSFSFWGSTVSKSSPFECGFSSFSASKEFFSVPFFLVSLVFLLFDVEILLLCLYPLILSSVCYTILNLAVLALVFSSTLYEWSMGALSWV